MMDDLSFSYAAQLHLYILIIIILFKCQYYIYVMLHSKAGTIFFISLEENMNVVSYLII